MGILDGNSKHEPLHYGEVFQLWEYSMLSGLALSAFQKFKSHAGDKDLKELLEDCADHAKNSIEECDELLKNNGIAPPPSLPETPPAKLEDIPVGARFTDPEIAAAITSDIAIGLTASSKTMATSIREDVGALFAKYHAAKTVLGLRALRLNKDKGWLIPPPLHIQQSD
ncbi:DUF3231 family protein [Cohnella pontilimi]|uniref:DUF3231 family protein n=1 Tax=Cohnella pontilimi TaxID=2564100 RepID=A0A4U0FC35_9BACL|nr:DUF3231 family protein [Cohnella pontilimi]TJY42290.1 DUF3231 family protein [Cohnella pontilimi]